MSLDCKERFANMVRQELEEILTVRQLENVMGTIWSALSAVDMTMTFNEERGDLSNDELLQAFLQAKRVEGRSASTLEHYRYIVTRFLSATKVPISDTTVNTIRSYYTSELDRGIAEKTVRGYQTVFSSMYGWLWREGLIRKNPCANIGVVKVPDTKKHPYSTVEIELIKESCKNLRDKAVVLFLMATGCRISEATQTNWKDINFQDKELVVFGKGSKERTVYLDDVACDVLKKYLSTRTDDNPALFIGKGGGRITPGGIRVMLKRLERVSHVQNIHPHRFRRTLATNLATKGMPVQEIAYILGHAKIDTTMRYICVQAINVKSHYQMLAA